MRIVMLENQSSGRGESAAAIEELCARLRAAGYALDVRIVGRGTDNAAITQAATGADLLIIVGGDGTVHHALPLAVQTQAAIYQIPFGTENLFARQFVMDHSVDRLLDAISRGTITAVDLIACNGRLLALMGSVGFDACVVERVAAARSTTVTRTAYIAHGLLELQHPRVPTLSVEIDGRTLVDAQPGLVVVANSRQYAARLDPARSASMTDGLLDVVFYPHRSRVRLVAWGLGTALGLHTRSRSLITARGTNVVVKSVQMVPFQLDGEAAGQFGGEQALTFEVRPRVLRVLTPG